MTDDRRLVDPELMSLLDQWPTLTLSEDMLPMLRARGPMFAPDPTDEARVDRVVRKVPGPEGAPPVEVFIYRPQEALRPLPCILHIHGGGFVVGDAANMEARHRPLAADLGCCIVSVNYRLAPETRFPGAVEDCYAALRWLVAEGGALGVDCGRIGVMGESAGGGLAAALALLVRDRGEYVLQFQHLIYPMLDDRTCIASDPHPHAGVYIWTPHNNRFGWSSLLGTEPGSEQVSPYAAPARATDLAGLPPTYLATGALDLFLEEDLEYARRLARAGVPVEVHVYEGAVHGFDLSPSASLAERARRDSRSALQRRLRPAPSA